jgi:hypothetical protein
MVLNNSQPMNPNQFGQIDQLHQTSPTTSQKLDLSQEFEKLALFIAQAWKEDHPDAHPDSQEDVEACVKYVTTEMAAAGKAVGGVAGLAILSGEGSKAARAVCRRVLASY